MDSIRVSPWRESEDVLLLELVQEFGPKKWKTIGQRLRSRIPTCTKSNLQCRERFFNHLSPGIRKGRWTEHEKQLIFSLHKLYANQWSLIGKHVPWRTENSIKCYFYWTIRKALGGRLGNNPIREMVKDRRLTVTLRLSDERYSDMIYSALSGNSAINGHFQ